MSALICFLSFLVAGAFADNATVNVTVYYESLCSDSIAFFTNRLIPTYTDKNYNFFNISPTVEIIPYGKENKTENGTYVCQHFASECDGNRLHACAIKFITDKQTLFTYIGCLMNATTPVNTSAPYPDPTSVCNTQAGSVLKSITDCYNNKDGDTLIDAYGEATKTFFTNHTMSVPFIAYNNKYDEVLSNRSQTNFRETLCSVVNLSNDYCSDTPKSGVAMLSASFALISALLFSFYAAQ